MTKSAGRGAVVARSGGRGSVAKSAPDRPPAVAGNAINAILHDERVNAELLRALLNGEVEDGIGGFHASTSEKILYVPHTRTTSEIEALLWCRLSGIDRRKWDRMDDVAAAVTYALTIATPEPEN